MELVITIGLDRLPEGGRLAQIVRLLQAYTAEVAESGKWDQNLHGADGRLVGYAEVTDAGGK